MDEVLNKLPKNSVLDIDDHNRELGRNLNLDNNEYSTNYS